MLPKLYILDDDRDTLELLSMVLRNQFEVKTAFDPKNLREDLTGFSADMVLLDHYVGSMHSPEIIVSIQQLLVEQGRARIPVVLYSGHEQLQKIYKSVGADGYLFKPSGIAEIRTYLLDKLSVLIAPACV